MGATDLEQRGTRGGSRPERTREGPCHPCGQGERRGQEPLHPASPEALAAAVGGGASAAFSFRSTRYD